MRRVKWSVIAARCLAGAIAITLLLAVTQCGVPNLEKPQCGEARDAVKQFYSHHFGNDMKPSAESLARQAPFLTAELVRSLTQSSESSLDYFTATADYPKAFRVGECKAEAADRTSFQIILLWRDDTRSGQKEVHVETVLTGGKWLINKVSN